MTLGTLVGSEAGHVDTGVVRDVLRPLDVNGIDSHPHERVLHSAHDEQLLTGNVSTRVAIGYAAAVLAAKEVMKTQAAPIQDKEERE